MAAKCFTCPSLLTRWSALVLEVGMLHGGKAFKKETGLWCCVNNYGLK